MDAAVWDCAYSGCVQRAGLLWKLPMSKPNSEKCKYCDRNTDTSSESVATEPVKGLTLMVELELQCH